MGGSEISNCTAGMMLVSLLELGGMKSLVTWCHGY